MKNSIFGWSSVSSPTFTYGTHVRRLNLLTAVPNTEQSIKAILGCIEVSDECGVHLFDINSRKEATHKLCTMKIYFGLFVILIIVQVGFTKEDIFRKIHPFHLEDLLFVQVLFSSALAHKGKENGKNIENKKGAEPVKQPSKADTKEKRASKTNTATEGTFEDYYYEPTPPKVLKMMEMFSRL